MTFHTGIEVDSVIRQLRRPIVIASHHDAGGIRQLGCRIGFAGSLRHVNPADSRRVGLSCRHPDRNRRLARTGRHGRFRHLRRIGRCEPIRGNLNPVIGPVDGYARYPERTGISIQFLLHIHTGNSPQHTDIETVFHTGHQAVGKRYLPVHRQVPRQPRKRTSQPGTHRRLIAARSRSIIRKSIAVIAGNQQFDRLVRPRQLGFERSRTTGNLQTFSFGHIPVQIPAVHFLKNENPHRRDKVLRLLRPGSRPFPADRQLCLRQTDCQTYHRFVTGCSAATARHMPRRAGRATAAMSANRPDGICLYRNFRTYRYSYSYSYRFPITKFPIDRLRSKV